MPSIPPAPNITSNTAHTIDKTKRKQTTIHVIYDDIGANRNVTDNRDLLENHEEMAPYPIGGGEKDEVAVLCTSKVFLSRYSQ